MISEELVLLGPTASWIVALCVGATMVAFNFRLQFDEPSYSVQSELCSKYKPRFSTSHSRYERAKFGYLLTIVMIYLVLSLVPEVFYALLGGTSKSDTQSAPNSPTVVPVIVAFALLSFQRMPFTMEMERRIRASFHALARIPEGVRRTIVQIRNAEFTFDQDTVSLQTKKLDILQERVSPLEVISHLICDDKLVGVWYRVGCLLAILDARQDILGIDPLFFDSYDDELTAITRDHNQVVGEVRKHANAILERPSLLHAGILNDDDTGLFDRLRNIQERLYTFLSCAVQSSANTDIEKIEILRRLGFVIRQSTPVKSNALAAMGTVGGLSFITIMIISVFTVYLSQLFKAIVITPLGNPWVSSMQIPQDLLHIYFWSWTTAAYYVSAIIGSIIIREVRISYRNWFNINTMKRDIPLLKYVLPIIVGTIVGCVTLTLIALVNGPGFHLSVAGLSDLQEAVILSYNWYPLSIVITFVSLWLVDSTLCDDSYALLLARSLRGGILMATIGFLTAYTANKSTVELTASSNHIHHVPVVVLQAVIYTSLFISLLIAIFSTALCFVVQLSEVQLEKTRLFVGSLLRFVSLQGVSFVVFLNRTGRALMLSPEKNERECGHPMAQGEWVQFPEGTVVQWKNGSGDNDRMIGDLGIISSSDGYLVYEGYQGRIQGEPEIVAHLVRLHPHAGNRAA
jgi:hypothetical protein